MSKKRSETRFTLGFNENDPNHLCVAQLLNTKGRQKSKFIVEAILFFEKNKYSLNSLTNESEIERVVRKILEEDKKKYYNNETLNKGISNLENSDIVFNHSIKTLDDNTIDSIARAMDMFKK